MIIKIKKNIISSQSPTYFIADIAANHDGSLSRAKKLIRLCALSGANAAKFQHYTADSLVSDYGFKKLGNSISHQASWKKSVYETYKDASLDSDWTQILSETCNKVGLSFFTSPYSFDLVDQVDQFIPAYKVGSGDITWIEIIKHMASKGKPILLATGASSMDDVCRAVDEILHITPEIILLQCNTNYTNQKLNFKHINLNVLKIYKKKFPKAILGLSDHTPGHANVLGAITLGARVIEKHYTLNNNLLRNSKKKV